MDCKGSDTTWEPRIVVLSFWLLYVPNLVVAMFYIINVLRNSRIQSWAANQKEKKTH